MIYEEIMNGGVKITCGKTIVLTGHVYITLYGTGDVVYNKYKASKGILEKLVIKQILPIKRSLSYGAFFVLYKDTLNAVWNEYDLIEFDEAKQLALDYYEMLSEKLQELEDGYYC